MPDGAPLVMPLLYLALPSTVTKLGALQESYGLTARARRAILFADPEEDDTWKRHSLS